jgi:hypothetical protein
MMHEILQEVTPFIPHKMSIENSLHFDFSENIFFSIKKAPSAEGAFALAGLGWRAAPQLSVQLDTCHKFAMRLVTGRGGP